MPAIKKRITAEYLEREQQRNEHNGRIATDPDDEKILVEPPSQTGPLKRKAPRAQILKRLDGEVLVEKRKRTLPPAEQKLDTWLDSNLEKKAESTLSTVKLYQFYTSLCQQDASYVVELDVFRTMLHNKFGKEIGLKESSAYSGLLKENKPRKKPVVAPSLGYKLKDLIQEALKASGNPSKGVMFAWVKKFIAGRYPALQIELRPHFLRKGLEREIYAGKVELVKGIGFCGFYRLPGPPEVDEDSAKSKKKGGKKKTGKEEESAESADDGTGEMDKEHDATGEISEETGEAVDLEVSKDKKKKKKELEEDEEKSKEGEITEDQVDDKSEKKKPKRKRKRTSKPKYRNAPNHSSPQTVNDIFPLAMTYMAEPKEASFVRIRKYLEKHYGKGDVDLKLKKCMEHGCDTGMWDRVSGSGASGSFQLQVDSFNPEHTESLTDMVCSAIIACNEPKVASVRLLKSYISEYHPEFNIDIRPLKLRYALERAERQNQLRRITGIGMGGSFQLVEQFIPSPAVLAGDADEQESEYEEDTGKEEVYVIRKTKSGRRAPLEKTQLDFSPTFRKKVPLSGGSRKGASRKSANKKSKYAESSSESEESSLDEDEEEPAGYSPKPTKSRGRLAPAAKKNAVKTAAEKTRSPPAKAKRPPPKARGGAAQSPKKPQKSTSSPKKSTPRPEARSASKKPARKVSSEEEVEEKEDEDMDTYIPQPTRRGRDVAPVSKVANKRRAPKMAEEEEDEENFFEVEEETHSPAKKCRGNKPAGRMQKAASTPQKGAASSAKQSSTSPGRTPRSASKSARKSLREMDSDEESEPEDGAQSQMAGDVNEEENYFEIEEENLSVAKKGRGNKSAAAGRTQKAVSAPQKRTGGAKKAPLPSTSPGRTPRSASKSARKSLREMDSDEDSELADGALSDMSNNEENEAENYFEIEDENPSAAIKSKGNKLVEKARKTATAAQKGTGEAKKAPVQPTTLSAGRPPRSASHSAMKSLREMDSDEESESEYVAQPTASRGGKKR